MNVRFKKSFLKDINQLKNQRLKDAIYECIVEVEKADRISQVKNLKKLSGFDSYYRIRIADYRIGLKLIDDTVYFVVLDHRKDIYKEFP
jgi:mRNA interferase RelE/StbE